MALTAGPLSFASQPTVTQINASNAANLIPKGPDAIAGIGDWHLSNGVVCAVISDIEHEGEFSTKGGVLVDLGFCARDDDHYTTSQDLLNASRKRPLDGQTIRYEGDDQSASIIVEMSTPGARQTTRYTLSATTPTRLDISKKLVRTTEEDLDFGLYASLNFNYHSLEPFVFSSEDLSKTRGFQLEDFVTRGNNAMTAAASSADTIITISPPTADAGIAYGWHLKSAKRVQGGEEYDVPKFVLADDESNALLVLSDSYYIGANDQIGWVQLPQIAMMELDPGAALEIEQAIYVGERGDVASVTDQLLRDQASINTQRIVGRVANINAAINISHADGTPFTHVRPSADGDFSFLAPPGEYTARLSSTAGRHATVEFAVNDDDIALGLLTLPGVASLELPKGEAMRLVVVGINGTESPNFIDTFSGASVNDDDGEHFIKPSSHLFLAGLPGDVESVELAAGAYRVYATRGPEYSLESTDIEIAADGDYRLDIALPKQVVTTPGYIASDLHVHASRSFDNVFSDAERVRTFVAEHGEVMVTSEHDVPVDFAPLIRQMGAERAITSIAGAEVTSLLSTDLVPYTAGHTNFFPYHPQPLEYRRGMVDNEDRRLRDIIDDVKQVAPKALVQLNHPRKNEQLTFENLPSNYSDIIDAGDYFDHMGPAGHPYLANKTLQEHPNKVLIERDPETGIRDLDFDLIEVVNPGGLYHQERIRAVRQDWLSLVKQGERKVATANSDSHRATEQVAIPRNMVAVTNDSVLSFDEDEFLASLKAGNSYGTTGPMLELSLSGKSMGQTFVGERGQLSLQIRSAPWIPVTKAAIQVNGETVAEYDLPDDNKAQLLIPLSFDKDSFVTIEVSGPASAQYRDIYAGITPYAFSNPIYVDFDADGEWQAPGL